MDKTFIGMHNFSKIVDIKKHITLNKDKLKFCQTEINFAGFELTPDRYTVSKEITDTISKYPTPNSRTNLRSFFGLANQLALSTN